jgi:membrane-bound serine protease (ClpP class)
MNTLRHDFIILASILAVALPLAVMLFFVLKLIIHSRKIKQNPSAGGLIGLTGRAESDISPEGFIFIRGELWPARSQQKIAQGKTVRVVGFANVTLEVETA